jgi:hypothetical protein
LFAEFCLRKLLFCAVFGEQSCNICRRVRIHPYSPKH